MIAKQSDRAVNNYNQKSMLKLREELLSVEADRKAGKVGVTIEQLDEMLKAVIAEVANEQSR